MAEASKIAWTRSTFNPFIGCTKVGPGCDHCYAEAQDARYRYGGAAHWGAGVPRYRTGASYWKAPIRWDRLAAIEKETGRLVVQESAWHTPGFWPVFSASLADIFDNEVPEGWRFEFWELVRSTPNLSWLLVTKRIGNVERMIPAWWLEGFPPNVRLLITVCNQDEADRDIPKLLALPCKNGISYEPALGPVDWQTHRGWLEPFQDLDPMLNRMPRVQWIIVGGESTQGAGQARPFVIDWARETIKQCQAAGVAVFMKQLGSRPLRSDDPDDRLSVRDRAGADPTEWPEDLKVQCFP